MRGRLRSFLIVALLAATSCAAPSESTPAAPGSASTTTDLSADSEALPADGGSLDGEPVSDVGEPPLDGSPAVPPISTPALDLDLDVAPAPFSAMRTPTGVPVAVFGQTTDGFLVRSPCGNAVEVSSGTPLDDIAVVLDPGHGGEVDTGAIGPDGEIERDLNLRLAYATEALLVDRGIGVELTRRGNYLLPLFVRAAFADDLEADILVSIHHNAPLSDPSDVPGTEVFVQSGSDESARLGGLLYEEVFDALSQFDLEWTTAPDAGVLRVLLPRGVDAYGMIRRPVTPTALVELGYIANPPEAELFSTDAYIVVAAVALADAVEAYLSTDRPGTGFGNPPRTFTPDFAPGADVCIETALE